MKIAICDDNKTDAGKIEFALMDLAAGIEIDTFEKGSELMESIKGGARYDLVFRDIYLGDENGIEIVNELMAVSPSTEVIFSTTSTDHAIEAFKVNAVGYLLKPYAEADVVKAFTRVKMRKEEENENVLVCAGSDRHLFRNNEVIKLESDLHYTKIYTDDGEMYRYHIGFSEIAKLFKGFIEIRRGVLLNMAHIKRIKAAVITLSDGSTYTIARGKKDYVVSQYTAFVIKRNGAF